MSEPHYQHSCPSLNPMSFRLIYWIRWLCHGTCRYFMSQFFVSYTLLLIQSIGSFVLCSTGVILPIIFKAACTVQSAKCKLLTHLLSEVLLPWLIWFHKLTGEKLLTMYSEKKTDRKKIKKQTNKRTKTKKFKSLSGKQLLKTQNDMSCDNLHFVIYRHWAHFISSDICLLVWFFIFV